MLARFLALAFFAVGCAAPAEEPETVARASSAVTAACTPAVIVVRHADDVRDGDDAKCRTNDADVRVNCLLPSGEAHAALYATELPKLVAQKNLCAVTRVVTHDPMTVKADGTWPSGNPYKTIAPFAKAIGVGIEELAPDAKLEEMNVLPAAGTSTVVSWDREGLAGNDGLLAQMSKTNDVAPVDRDMVYVFTNPDANQKLDRAEYRQFFQSPSFGEGGYARYKNGHLGPVVPTAMTICEMDGKDCTTEGAKGTTIMKDSPLVR